MKQTKQTKQQRQEALQKAIEEVKKKFGESSIMRLREAETLNVDTITTGFLSLDIALGKGLPLGRIIEIFGPEMAGKTSLALHIIAQFQKKGGSAAFIDAEHALDPEYAKKIGVNIKDLYISQPNCGEQALEIVDTLTRSEGVDLIVVDSVAALTPKKEIEGEMGGQYIGLQAKLMSQAMRKLAGIINKTKTTVIFINQTRQKIGMFFGNPETTPGGMALKFYTSIRIRLQRTAQIKKGEQAIGNQVKVKIVKNKVAPPFQVCTFQIMYDEGISRSSDVLILGLKHEIIKKSGLTFTYGEKKLGVGQENTRLALKKDIQLMIQIEKDIKTKIKTDKDNENKDD